MQAKFKKKIKLLGLEKKGNLVCVIFFPTIFEFLRYLPLTYREMLFYADILWSYLWIEIVSYSLPLSLVHISRKGLSATENKENVSEALKSGAKRSE